MINDKIKALNKPVPIILGGYVNGLGLVRSFGRVGIPSICLDRQKSLTFYSKYSIPYLCPDPEKNEIEFLRYLIELGKCLPHKGMLFATNDIWLVPISKNREELSKYYLYPMSEWSIIEKCWNKRYLYDIAQKVGIPIAKTYFVERLSDFDVIANDIHFPCVIKPENTIGFREKLKSKGRTITISNYEQLMYWRKRIIDAELDNTPLIFQELIIGPVTSLYTITSYSNTNADIIAYSIGHKIRQTPPDAGTIVSGRVKHNPEVLELGTKLIKALGFYGIANTEFKQDEKDQKFKLIEINPRPGMWNYSALMSGINLPYIAYRDLLGESFELFPHSEEEKVWIMLLEDFSSSLFSFRKDGYAEYAVSPTEWFRTVWGKKIFAIESFHDPMPGVVHAVNFFAKVLFRLSKIGNKSR